MMKMLVLLAIVAAVLVGGYMMISPVKHQKSPVGLICKLEKKMEIEIYSTDTCPYCVRAKNLLDLKGLPYKEINVSQSHEMRKKMLSISGGKTSVPQIVINGKHVGGFDDLNELNKSGELDEIIGSCQA